jgi:hypothetical protein
MTAEEVKQAHDEIWADKNKMIVTNLQIHSYSYDPESYYIKLDFITLKKRFIGCSIFHIPSEVRHFLDGLED